MRARITIYPKEEKQAVPGEAPRKWLIARERTEIDQFDGDFPIRTWSHGNLGTNEFVPARVWDVIKLG